MLSSTKLLSKRLFKEQVIELTAVVEVSAETRSIARPWRVLAAASVLQTGFSITEMGLPTLTGFLKSDLHLSAATAGLAVSSYLIGKTSGSYVAGRLADTIGETKVLVVGACLTGLLYLVAVLTPYPAMYGVFAIAGLAGSGSMPAGGSLVRNAFPPRLRGVALGLRQTGIALGGLIAAASLPWIARAHGWRWSLAISAVATIVAVVPLLCSTEARDVASRVSVRAARGVKVVTREVGLLTVWGTIAVTGQYVVLVFLPLDLHARRHLSVASAASFVALLQGAGVVGRVGLGWMSDRWAPQGRKAFLFVVTVGAVIGTGALSLISGSSGLVFWIPLTLVEGITLVGFQGLWVTMLAEAAHRTRVGAAMGFAVTFSIAGGAIAPPLFGLAVDATGTYRTVWAILTVLLIVSLAPLFLIERRALR
jgi:MFS family permease